MKSMHPAGFTLTKNSGFYRIPFIEHRIPEGPWFNFRGHSHSYMNLWIIYEWSTLQTWIDDLDMVSHGSIMETLARN